MKKQQSHRKPEPKVARIYKTVLKSKLDLTHTYLTEQRLELSSICQIFRDYGVVSSLPKFMTCDRFRINTQTSSGDQVPHAAHHIYWSSHF